MEDQPCASCSLCEDMLIEYERANDSANLWDDRRTVHQHVIFGYEADLAARRATIERLTPGPARERLERDLIRIEGTLETARLAEENASWRYAKAYREAKDFATAVREARTCDHVGYLSEGVDFDGMRARWAVPPRLRTNSRGVMPERLDAREREWPEWNSVRTFGDPPVARRPSGSGAFDRLVAETSARKVSK